MGIFKSGMALEDRIMAHLDKVGYDVEQDETLNHDYKIDFSIRKFPQNPKHYSLGVQVTERCDDLDKLRGFHSVHKAGYQVVDRVLYIEVEHGDFEKGVGYLISTAISDFQFNTEHAAVRMKGVRIRGNMTFEFFDIGKKLSHVETTPVVASAPVTIAAKALSTTAPVPLPLSEKELSGAVNAINQSLQGGSTASTKQPKLVGYINAYYRTRDHGFITAQDGETYFFHLAGVSDGILRDKVLALPPYDWAAPVEGTVEFLNMGKTRPQAKYPEAKYLKLASVQ